MDQYTGTTLAGTARKLYDFAKLHGLRDDWHEPDEQKIRLNIHEGEFDNAHGDDFGSGECLINLWQGGRAGDAEHDICLNLATLCALATIGAGVVLGKNEQVDLGIKDKDMTWLPVAPLADAPRFSLNELNAILSTVLKSIGES